MNSMTFKLTRPVEFEGETYNELQLDFDAMTGRDVVATKREFEQRNPLLQKSVIAMDTDFAACFAARAAKVPVGLLDHVSAPDYIGITQAAINFLLFSGLLSAEFQEMKKAREAVAEEMAKQTSTEASGTSAS